MVPSRRGAGGLLRGPSSLPPPSVLLESKEEKHPQSWGPAAPCLQGWSWAERLTGPGTHPWAPHEFWGGVPEEKARATHRGVPVAERSSALRSLRQQGQRGKAVAGVGGGRGLGAGGCVATAAQAPVVTAPGCRDREGPPGAGQQAEQGWGQRSAVTSPWPGRPVLRGESTHDVTSLAGPKLPVPLVIPSGDWVLAGKLIF